MTLAKFIYTHVEGERQSSCMCASATFIPLCVCAVAASRPDNTTIQSVIQPRTHTKGEGSCL
jgi:hypothetical protein